MLTSARRWCTIVLLTAQEQPASVDAILATGLDLVPAGNHRLAVWVERPADLDHQEVAAATVVLSGDPEVVSQAGGRGLFVPAPSASLGAAVLVAPFVRARLRAARGLPRRLIMERDDDRGVWTCGPNPLPSDLVVTAVALASAAVTVDGPGLISAMAWGTPCVTDRVAAEAVGARPGSDVLVADSAGERRALAMSIAEDSRMAARLSCASQLVIAERHDPARAAARLLRRLWLAPATQLPGPPLLAAQLSELGAPDDAVVTTRVASAFAGFTGAGA